MQLKRLLFCLLIVAIVCTPLTAVNTNGNRRQHQSNRRMRISDFDPNLITEKNRTKNTMLVTSRGALMDNNNNLPLARSFPYVERFKDDTHGTLLRAPRVDQIRTSHRYLNMNTLNHNDFSKDKCASANFQKDEKRKFACKPRETIVYLTHQENLILSPSAVAVKRCDGMCEVHSKCIPKETQKKIFFIRQSQNNQATCGSIEVEEHVSCSCSCPERQAQCSPHQIYDQEQCKCKCPENVTQNCSNNKMSFSTEECKCKCRNYKKCSTLSHFDENICSCPLANEPTLG